MYDLTERMGKRDMKNNLVFMIVLLLLILVVSGNAQAAEPTMVIHNNLFITDGTPMAVEVDQDVNFKNIFVGEKIGVDVLENFIIDNVVVIEKGSKVFVLVSNVGKDGEWSKDGGITIQPQYVITRNGVKVPLKQGIKKYNGEHDLIQPFSEMTIEDGEGSFNLLGINFMPAQNKMISTGTKFIITVDGHVDLGITAEKLTKVITNELSSKSIPIIYIPKAIQNLTDTWNTNRGKTKLVPVGNKLTGTY